MIFAWLSKLFSGTAFYIILALFLAGAGGLTYWSITSHASEIQALKDKVVILQNSIKEQQEYNQKLEQLIQINTDSLNSFAQDKDKIKDDMTKLNEYLMDKDTQKEDRPSSEILKKTIEQLRKRQ